MFPFAAHLVTRRWLLPQVPGTWERVTSAALSDNAKIIKLAPRRACSERPPAPTCRQRDGSERASASQLAWAGPRGHNGGRAGLSRGARPLRPAMCPREANGAGLCSRARDGGSRDPSRIPLACLARWLPGRLLHRSASAAVSPGRPAD